MNISMEGFTTLLLCFSLLSITTMYEAVDTLSASQSLTGNQTIVSADESFELGFFIPQNSENQYLGIWYKKIRPITVVWVANRESALPRSTGALKVTGKGVLVVLNPNKTAIWSSNSSGSVQNPVAQLLPTGNLVVKDANDDDPENFLWQSFDYPGDTFLPVFKLGRIRATGFDRILTSWKSPQDPSPGSFTYRVEPHGYPQLVLSEGSTIKYRTGPWNGLRYSGTPNLRENPIYKFGFVLNDKEMYYSYQLLNSSVLSRMILSSTGVIQRYMWIDRTQGWSLYLTAPIDNCDAYKLCGSHGSCNVDNSPVCQCMRGFVPKSPQEWDRVDWSNGCVRRTPLNCSNDVFLKYTGLKLPDTQWSRFNTSMNLEECEIVCTKNCNCTAYSNLDIRDGGSGCLMWFGDLIDIREYNQNGQDLYIRMAASEAGKLMSKQNQKKKVAIIVSIVLGTLILVLVLIVYILKKKKPLLNREGGNSITQSQKEDLELPLFDFPTIATATNYFSENNKLGEGGFGPVYKGTLKEGQEIAVKMLSRNSNQGINEFKNEVTCIAKLQHRNLVKLLGCCIEEEKILLYEYMPNKSLDFFIFDQTQRKLLNWQKCFDIINGIARGLLYLHQDSRLRIVHRDLKASNILLDYDMNPKISDFGLARSFGGNETAANTNKVVGTYGYMSPEYAIDGIFSVKSDVYSYGVLVLEIVSGKRNRGFSHPDHRLNLIGHAWKLFYEDRSLELIEEYWMGESCNRWEVSRSIHVGLLCVQRNPEDRPSMASVVLMLTSDITLAKPKEPGFFTQRDIFDEDSSSSYQTSSSGNKMSITMFSGR